MSANPSQNAPLLEIAATSKSMTTKTPTPTLDSNSNSNNKKKKKKINLDPNGSLAVARGNLTPKSLVGKTTELLSSRSESELHQIRSHYEGPHAKEAQDRRQMLQNKDLDNDNNNNNNSNDTYNVIMTDHQQRALKRRQQHFVKTNIKLHGKQVQRLEAAVAAVDAQTVLNTEQAGFLQVENDMERTTQLTQIQLKNHYLDQQMAQQIFDLHLQSYAPYGMHFDRSGRASILFGQRGHVGLLDHATTSLVSEFHIGSNQCIRDACWLHNPSLCAVAQSNHVYIYDSTGAEIHKLSDHQDPFALDYLPHHWLLCSLGRAGWLKYQDVSTGELVSQHRTQLASNTRVLRQNPYNAVVHVGHLNGTVTLWSPALSTYLVKMQCHKGAPITSLAVQGHVMVTGGSDAQVKVWDMRMYKVLHAYYCKGGGIPTSLDISQRGILGVGHGCHVTFWKDCSQKHTDPYMYHGLPGRQVSTVRFRPFQDVCGIGHSQGISSIVIPGSGEPNVDSSEYHTNPFGDQKQNREAEVRSLLDKLAPNMIALDPDVVATIEVKDAHLKRDRLEQEQDNDAESNNNTKDKKKKKVVTKKRGRSKIQTQLRRKARNVVDDATLKLREAREAEKRAKKENEDSRRQQQQQQQKERPAAKAPAALLRFFQ